MHIIVLNWNGYSDTKDCIDSLSQIDYDNYKIVVVDNGSDSYEVDNLLVKHPKIKIIKSDQNLGFSGGNNLGIDYSIISGADYITLLNNDTVVEYDFLSKLVKFSEENDNVGISVPKINYYSDSKRIWFGGGYISRLRGSGFTVGEGDPEEKYNKNKFISFATGCCLLIKSKVINDIGKLDLSYFLYLEDVDYCMRTILSGYKILYVGESKIYHKVSISSTKKNENLPLYYVSRNRFYFVKKYVPKFYWLSFAFLFLIFLSKIFFWLVQGHKEKSKIVVKALTDYFANKMGKCEHL